MAKDEQALATIADLSNYPALQNQSRTIQMIEEALGGERLSIFTDLNRVHVPGGGGTTWEMPDIERGTRPEQTITGIIIHNQYSRAFYSKPYGNEDSGPPDCQSWDPNLPGVGDPGGDCLICPYNEFESAPNGKGKACGERRFLFLLTSGDSLPLVVQASPTSLAPMRHFGLHLGSSKNKRLREIVIDLSLKKEVKNGYPTAIIVPTINSYLSEKDCVRVEEMASSLRPFIAQASRGISQEPTEYLDDEDED